MVLKQCLSCKKYFKINDHNFYRSRVKKLLDKSWEKHKIYFCRDCRDEILIDKIKQAIRNKKK